MTTDNTEGQSGGEKLYAGKFKTVEELEAGYKNSLPTFQENESLKTKLKEATEVPVSYLNPADVELDANRVSDLQARAREAGLTQAQYEKMVRDDKKRVDNYKSTFENARKEVGEETLNILRDYVGKHYPKALQDNMLNTFIVNKEARQAALDHRQQLLNNRVPGMDKTPAAGGYTVTDEDINKAYAAKEKNKGDMRAREHYMNLLAARAAQKSA